MPLPWQPLAGPRRIGLLESGTTTSKIDPFRDGMRSLGYVEGQDFLIEYRDAEGDQAKLPALAAELVGMPVEVIVSGNVFALVAASRATSSIPIVAASANVVASGLVVNIARPEGNITGVTSNSVETVGKWIELLKETVPTISHLAAVYDGSGPSAPAFLRQLRRATQALDLQLTSYDLRALDQLAATLLSAKTDGADSLLIVTGGVIGAFATFGDEALKSRLPAVAEGRSFAVNGGLLAHGANSDALARRSASYVDKILKGAKPGELPIELPTVFDIVVNLKTAHALGIVVPQSVLQQATEVIQ